MKNNILFLFILSIIFFSNCKDSCDDSACQHNGFCESGVCACTERYTGNNCELEVLPTAVKLQSFVIHTHEIKPNGDPWDNEPGDEAMPDIYIKILDADNNVFRSTENFVAPNISKSTLSFEVEITDITKIYTLLVFDEDGATDDLVYELPFQPYVKDAGFPANLTKTYSANNIAPTENGELTINMSYCF